MKWLSWCPLKRRPSPDEAQPKVDEAIDTARTGVNQLNAQLARLGRVLDRVEKTG